MLWLVLVYDLYTDLLSYSFLDLKEILFKFLVDSFIYTFF